MVSRLDQEVDTKLGRTSPESGGGAGALVKGNHVSWSLVQISEVLLLVQEIPGYARM